MRILFIINTMGRGGAEVQVRDLALRLVARGHRVAVLVMLPYEDFEDELRAGGVETATLGMSKGRATARALRETVALSRRFSPDVVHSHLFAANILARVALGPRRIVGHRPRIVGTVHARYEKQRWRYGVYRATARLADAFTCVSHRGIEEHEAGGAARKGSMLYVPNGIDVASFGVGPEREGARRALGVTDEFVWLAVGSFRDEDKDYGTMLNAFAARRRGDERLLLAGEGRLLDEKIALARRLGLGDSVRFLGLRSDVPALLAAADGYLLSSASEALPIVLLEAAAVGLPIVATNVGDVTEVVIDGKTGLVVAPRNPEAFAVAMDRLRAMTASERATLGERARERVASVFDLEAVVNEWERTYRSLLGGEDARRRAT